MKRFFIWGLSFILISAVGLGAGTRIFAQDVQELVTEPLTEKEQRTDVRTRQNEPAVKTPTPEWFGHKIIPRRYGDPRKTTRQEKTSRDEGEIFNEPLLGESSTDARPEPTPTPRPRAAPGTARMFSYTAGNKNPGPRDPEGPIPEKGLELTNEPLYADPGPEPERAPVHTLQIKADLSSSRVHIDESFTLTVEISGEELPPQPLVAPQIAGMDLINQSQAESRISRQGRMEKLMTYHFTYLPLATGAVTVLPISVSFKGNHYKTEAMSLEVEGSRSGFAFQKNFSGRRALLPKMVASAPDAAGLPRGETEADFFSQLSQPSVYVNQQVNLTVRFHLQTEIGTKVAYMPPSLVGFISEELPATQGEALVSGTRQRTIERLYRTALFPIHAGSLGIGPAQAVISQSNKEKTQTTDSLNLEVKALPPDPEARSGEPSNGLVGKYTLSSKLESASIEAGSPLRVIFILKGQGIVRGAPEPQLPASPVLQWQLEEQRAVTQIVQDVVQGECFFQYLMVPREPGKITPGSARIRFFNPEIKQWQTAQADLPVIWVKPKPPSIQTTAVVSPAQARESRIEALSLRPNHAGSRNLRLQQKPLVEKAGFWLLQSGFAVLLLGSWGWTHRRRKPGQSAALRAKRSGPEMFKALKRMERHIQDKELQAFYDGVSRATAEYLSAKFEIPVTLMVIERLPEYFEQHGIPERFQSQFKIALTVCEYVRYAAMEFPVRDMRTLHKDLIRTVEAFEKFWRQQQARRKKLETGGALFFIGTMLLGALAAHAGETELYFLKGNNLAHQGKVEAALAEYQKVIALGADDADVYFNLGNMYLLTGQTGRAILAYERGLQISPRNPDLQANLRQAAECVPGFASVDDGWTEGFSVWRWYQSWTPDELAGAASFSFGLSVVFLAGAWFWPWGRSRVLRWIGIGFLGLAALLAIWCAARSTEGRWRKRAVVLAAAAEMRGRPYAGAEVLFTLPEGTRVKVEREDEEWVEVQARPNRHGWVIRSQVTKIDQ